eukprot:236206_1
MAPLRQLILPLLLALCILSLIIDSMVQLLDSRVIHYNRSSDPVVISLELQHKMNKTHDTNMPSTKYLIISLNYGSPYNESSAKAIENQRCYAMKNNYTYQVFDENDLKRTESNYFTLNTSFCDTSEGGRFKAYYKAFVMHHVFTHPSYQSFEYFLFVDHDLLFTNYAVTIDDILTKAYRVNQNTFGTNKTNPISFVFSRRGELINSGNMLFKNTEFMQNVVDTWYNVTVDICVEHIEWGGMNFPDQTILNFILNGGNYTHWKEHVLNHLNDTNQITEYTKEWGRQCLDKKKTISRGTPPERVMSLCIHKRFHPHVAILNMGFFNCIQQQFRSCKQFVIHFAGAPPAKKALLIKKAVDEIKLNQNNVTPVCH